MVKPLAVEPPPPPRLEAAAEAVMSELREALAGLLARLPGRIARAVDVERSLGVSKKLAWQVFRIATSDTLGEVANVPLAAAMRTLLAAARKKRVPAEVLGRAARAFERFEAFAAEHAGDRAGLVTLVSGLAAGGGAGEAYEASVRKAAFRANAHLWGAKSRMQTRTVIFLPKPELRVEDNVLVMGDLGVQRLRQGEPLTLVRWMQTGGSAAASAGVPPTIDHGPELLREFCTHPLPAMVPSGSALGGGGGGGVQEAELVIPPGLPGAVTIYSTQHHENAEPMPHTPYDAWIFLTTPVETAVWEVLAPAGVTDPSTARFIAYGRRAHPELVREDRTIDLLPQRETVNYLGALDHIPALPGAPRHAEVVERVLARHGWQGKRMDIYRCRVAHPLLHSYLCLRVDAARR